MTVSRTYGQELHPEGCSSTREEDGRHGSAWLPQAAGDQWRTKAPLTTLANCVHNTIYTNETFIPKPNFLPTNKKMCQTDYGTITTHFLYEIPSLILDVADVFG